MARAPQALFRQEDFGDLTDPDTVARFLRLLNGFTNDTRSGFAQALTFADNFAAAWREITVKTDGAGALPKDANGNPKTKFAPALPGSYRPKSITIERAWTIDESSRIETPASVSSVPAWTLTGDGQVALSALAGLAASTKYRLLLLVKGG